MIHELLSLQTVSLDDSSDAVIILDQTQLPEKEVYLTLLSAKDIWEAIYHLKVRGAPAIGIAAAYGIYICSKKITEKSFEPYLKQFLKIKEYLASSRPTAVNLTAALNRMEKIVLEHSDKEIAHITQLLKAEADAIRAEDAAACKQIGEYGLSLLKPGMGILTHCNAGHLAVSEYGTALAPVYLGEERGYGFKVFADETRPLLQGARLTAYELQRAGIDVTLICDNMAASIMQNGKIDAVLVGCDRIAANGDVANKIGTLGVAILAKYYGIPFYVLGPTTTIDAQCYDGKAIIIEEREASEITEMWYTHRMAPENIKICNPAFDVTPHALITAIITDKGIMNPPFEESLRKLFS